MAIIYQGIILLLVFSLASAQTSLPNPECRGMHTAARHLQTGIKSIPFLALQGSAKAKCNPTKPCSGVICTWSSNSILEVDLHYCKDPVNYYVHFKDQGLSVDNNLTIGEKGEQILYEKRNFVTIKIKVTKLHRIESKVTTRVVLLVCYFGRPCTSTPVLPQQTFCVRMDKCSGFNASVDHYKSCTYTSPQTTFIPSSHWSVTRTDPPYSLRSSSSDSFAQGYRREEKDKSSKDLSTGAIIGICVAGLFVILIVVGAAVYWKKYHRRTRLRAAYYNDISMHDPLCGEDFGPEVA